MNSKYIKNSRVNNRPKSFNIPTTWKDSDWFSMTKPKEEQKEIEEYNQKLKSEKQRIESITLEELSFRDLYVFPFKKDDYSYWVWDSNDHFIFQFLSGEKEDKEKIISILNGEIQSKIEQEVTHKSGYILINEEPFILIRNWGGLTGIGGVQFKRRLRL